MSIFRRVMFDMCIRQEYRSFITDVYTNMDWSLFSDPRLNSVDIPQGTTEIGEGAFNNCRSLKEITVPGYRRWDIS